MTRKTTSSLPRRHVLRLTVWLSCAIIAGLSSGCALPMLMKAKQKKISQDHFSCGEDCPAAVKGSPRQR